MKQRAVKQFGDLLVMLIIVAVDEMFQLSKVGQCVVLDADEIVVST